MKHFLRFAFLGILLASSLWAEPAVVGHPGLTGQNLDAEGVKAVLLGKRVALGSARVVLVIAKASAAQDALLQSSVGMSTAQFQTYWRRLFMTGGGSAPKVVDSEADAAKVAAETAGAVAIVDAANVGGLAVLGK